MVRRTPLCNQQLQHRICTMPPPSSGGLALLQTLALLNQNSNLASSSASEPQVWRQLASAQAYQTKLAIKNAIGELLTWAR